MKNDDEKNFSICISGGKQVFPFSQANIIAHRHSHPEQLER
jgi:hypothetical protein